MSNGGRPNILVTWGDDIDIGNLSRDSDRLKAASFTIDQAVARLETALTTGH
jgi:hypothetical protein